jgi:ribosome-associated protein
MKKEFDLAGHEFIELNKLLKLLRLVSSGGDANQMIVNGEVKVNGEVELQKRKKLRPNDKVEFMGKEIVITSPRPYPEGEGEAS